MKRCPDCSTRHNGSHICPMDGVETRESSLGKRVKRVGERPSMEPEAMNPTVSLDDLLRMAAENRPTTQEDDIPDGGPRSVLNDPQDGTEQLRSKDFEKPKKHIGLTPDTIRKALAADEGAVVPPQIAGQEIPEDETILLALRRLGVRYIIDTHPDTGRKWVRFPLDVLVKKQGPQRVGAYRPAGKG